MPKSQTIFVKISDEAVKEKTGKTWEHWFKILDGFNVKENGHKLAARHLADKHQLSPWWSQAVTIRYEWERGLRTVENQWQVTPDHSLFKNSTKNRVKH